MTCTGCLEPFAFDKEDQDDTIVVDGQLTTSSGPHYVRTSNVLAFGDKFFDPVEGIRVQLHYNTDTYDYEEIAAGVHVIPEGVITGQPGESYYISMVLPNGDVVSSQPDVMPDKYEFDEVHARFKRELVTDKFGITRRDRIVEVTINASFPEILEGEEFYLRYGIEEDFSYPEMFCGGLHQPKTCYINEPAFSKDFTLFYSGQSSKSNIDSLLIHTATDLSGVFYRGKHYFSVSQYSISEAAYAYWLKVKEVTNQSGTVFDKPPAAVGGNLYNETDPGIQVLGYFELASVDLKRDAILPFEYFADSPDQDECSIFNRRNWPNRCCQCLNINNAGVERPPWF